MMQNEPKMPNYDELVGLSNGELTKRTRLALKRLLGYQNQCKELNDARKIYETYKREQQKRLLVGKRITHPYF